MTVGISGGQPGTTAARTTQTMTDITIDDLIDEAQDDMTGLYRAVSRMIGCETIDPTEVAIARHNVILSIHATGYRGSLGRAADAVIGELLTVGHGGSYILASVAQGKD